MLGIALSSAGERPVDPFSMNDWEFVEFLRAREKSSGIIEDILNRRLFKRVKQYNYSSHKLMAINEALESLANTAFIVDVIPPISFSGKDRIKSEIRAMRGGRTDQIENISPLVRALGETLDTRSIIVSARKDSVKEIEGALHGLP
ncbi:MAG: hypothetical protein M1463_04885, partial [Candidatus Thermoplasmatota archaeon]|nr:hypothetical protein [Candidatus Thermoplasmatota archaeon]